MKNEFLKGFAEKVSLYALDAVFFPIILLGYGVVI